MTRIFNKRQNTIRKLRAKFRATGRVADLPRRPMGRVTSRAQDRQIVLSHLRNRFLSAAATARQIVGTHARPIHPKTVRNRLKDVGLHARRPLKVPPLTARHRRARLAWARRYLRFTRADWSNVLFVDETRIKLRSADGRVRVYRRREERGAAACVVNQEQMGGGSVMMWAGVSMHTKTPLVPIQGNLTSLRYQAEIVQPHIIPHVQANRGMQLAQDNAPCHVARGTMDMMTNNNVRVLDWPARSPDLNPIEHLWDKLKRGIRARPAQLTLQELRHDAIRTWANIPQNFIQRYIVSMRARCRAVIQAVGGNTMY